MPDGLINQRYRLESIIGQGGMGIVYRALDRLTGTQVALKRVVLQPQTKDGYFGHSSSDSLRLSISQEFRVLSSLRHPHIISVLDYGFDVSRDPFFTMELLDNPLTVLQAVKNLSNAQKTGLLIQMLQALAYLHRRTVIHRDLKPDNVLVVANKVKLLDFGLAVESARDEKPSDDVSGTPLYMAPEVLTGAPASASSDIYTAGLIAFELYVGKHPFAPPDSEFTFVTIGDMVNGRVDVTRLPDIPVLRSVIAQMVEYDPANRARDLNVLIDSLRPLADDQVLSEPILIRESFLQSASFVGRVPERQKLITAMNQARERHGSIWLIGGESGVGKSRLIDELQTQALVGGILVLRGQAVAEGSAPYQVWRPVVRRLVLQTSLEPLEAGILSSLVTDIERLLEAPVEMPPEVDGPIAQQRLLNLVEAVFRSQNQPMLVLLEDLQWAGEGMTILKHFLNIVSELPLLVVGTYRDNEYPTLPAEMPGAQVMLLQRFDPTAIAQLTRAMIGESNYTPGISTLLQAETEGNALFMIEIVRALADESGGLARIGQTTLPHSMLSGGIQSILRRRLDRVPAEAHALLQQAATAGRELDLALLKVLSPGTDLDVWLLQAMTVVEVQDNRYRFAHDKLREAILSQVSAETRSALYEQVARGMETLYDTDPTQYMALAYQWEKANEHRAPDAERLAKTIHYLEKAAELLYTQNAFVQSGATYQRLFKWHEQYRTLVPGGIAPEREANWYGAMSNIEALLSNQDKAISNAVHAMALYGIRIPTSQAGLIGAIAVETAKQIAHRLQPNRFINRAPDAERERLIAIAPIISAYGTANFALARQLPGLYASLRSVNTHEYAGLGDRLAGDYAMMVNLTGALGLNNIVERYYQQVRQLSEKHPNASPYALFLTSVYYAPTANRQRAERDLAEASINYERTKNMAGWCLSQITLASIYSSKGEFARSYALFEHILQTAVTHQIASAELVILPSLARLDVFYGNLSLAIQRLDRAVALIRPGIEPSIDISVWANRALALWRLEAFDEALQTVNYAVGRISELKVSPAFAVVAFVTLIDILLDALEVPALLPKATNIGLLSQTLLGLIKRLRMLPANADKSMVYRVQARYAWLNKKPAVAGRLARKALSVAVERGAAYEIALIHYELGRHLPTSNPDRLKHLEQAHTAFKTFGFPSDIARVAAALANEVEAL
jgi:serine/threonine protein kinase